MMYEINPTSEQIETATKAPQTRMIADINVDGKFKLAVVVSTPDLVQVMFHNDGKFHFFTRNGFSKYTMRIPDHAEVERRLYNIMNTKKYGKGHFQNMRSGPATPY